MSVERHWGTPEEIDLERKESEKEAIDVKSIDFAHFSTYLEQSKDPAALAKALLDAGFGWVVARYLDKFPPGSVDVPDLAKSLLEEGVRANFITHNLSSFLASPDIDPFVLATLLIDHRMGDVVASKIDKFLARGGTDPSAFTKALLEAGKIVAVAQNIVLFPPGSVDMPALVRSLIDDHLENEIVYQLDDFLAREDMDPSILAKSLIEVGRSDVIVQNLDKFPQGSVDMSALAKSLLDIYGEDIFINNLDRLLRHDFDLTVLSPEEVERVRSRISISEVIKQQRFNLLWLFSLNQDSGSLKEEVPLTQSQLEATYYALLRDGRNKNAFYLEKYAQAVGFSLPDREKIKTVDHTKPRQDVVNFIENRKERSMINPEKEVVQFYLDDAILHSLMKLDLVPDAATRLSFRDRMTYESLKKDCERHIKSMTRWLCWYLVDVVTSELNNQDMKRGKKLILPLPDPDRLASGPVEDVLDFFAAASSQFGTGSWAMQYGGKRWAAIASAGYALWSSDTPSREIIDHIIDLEHNTGAIFDKGEEYADDEKTLLEEILDLKFSTPRAENFLNALPADAISNRERIRFREDLQAARRLENALA